MMQGIPDPVNREQQFWAAMYYKLEEIEKLLKVMAARQPKVIRVK